MLHSARLVVMYASLSGLHHEGHLVTQTFVQLKLNKQQQIFLEQFFVLSALFTQIHTLSVMLIADCGTAVRIK